MPKDKYVNEDTYQTLEDTRVEPQSDFEKATKVLWKKKQDFKLQLEQSPHKIFVGTPVHSDVSMHYTQALLEFQQACFAEKIQVTFQLSNSKYIADFTYWDTRLVSFYHPNGRFVIEDYKGSYEGDIFKKKWAEMQKLYPKNYYKISDKPSGIKLKKG